MEFAGDFADFLQSFCILPPDGKTQLYIYSASTFLCPTKVEAKKGVSEILWSVFRSTQNFCNALRYPNNCFFFHVIEKEMLTSMKHKFYHFRALKWRHHGPKFNFCSYKQAYICCSITYKNFFWISLSYS